MREIATGAAAKHGTEFVHAEIGGSKRNPTVRVIIDKPEGVTVEDCSTVSREIEAVMDAEDFIPSSYMLEVSSPGIERGLYSLADFEKFAGKRAKVKTDQPIEGQSAFTGTIVSVDDGTIVFDDRTSGTVRIPYDSVAKANLKIDLGEEFKKRR